jgi:hypothetical protein
VNYKLLLPALITLAAFSSVAHAKQEWFEVEVLIFERNVDMNKIGEHSTTNLPPIDTKRSIELIIEQSNKECVKEETCLHQPNPVTLNKWNFNKETGFNIVPTSDFKLKQTERRLANHALFKPVFHGAWRMPISSARYQKPIHIFSGENFALNKNIDNNETHADKWAIDGNLKIYLNHFLYVNSQLIVRKETREKIPEENIEEEAADLGMDNQKEEGGVEIVEESKQATRSDETRVVIKEMLFDQTRKMRSEEIHYFDHPMMGMIIQIRKIPK